MRAPRSGIGGEDGTRRLVAAPLRTKAAAPRVPPPRRTPARAAARGPRVCPAYAAMHPGRRPGARVDGIAGCNAHGGRRGVGQRRAHGGRALRGRARQLRALRALAAPCEPLYTQHKDGPLPHHAPGSVLAGAPLIMPVQAAGAVLHAPTKLRRAPAANAGKAPAGASQARPAVRCRLAPRSRHGRPTAAAKAAPRCLASRAGRPIRQADPK